MTPNAFNTAAYTPQPYVFDLNHEVAAFYRDHPEQRQNIFFIDACVPTGMLERGDGPDEDEIAGLLGMNADLQDTVLTVYKTGICYSTSYSPANYGCVILKTSKGADTIKMLGFEASSDIADAYSFDHETGHQICEGGSDGAQIKRECIADAYAVIRCLQRSGNDPAAVENLVVMRTLVLGIGRDTVHFTAPMIEKILADSRATEFSKLTPAETVARAVRYGTENITDPVLSSYIADKLGLLSTIIADMMRRDFSTLRSFSKKILETTAPDEFKWASTAIKGLLDGNISLDGTRLPKPPGPEWTRLRAALDARAARFEQPQQRRLIVVSP